MAQAAWFRSCILASIAFSFALALMAQGTPADLQKKLNAQFKLTTITADRTDIVTAGDVVVIHKPGVIMFDVAEPLPPTNVYKAGKIGQGFGTAMLMSNNQTQKRRFVPEEKCWLTRIVVQNDSVSFDLYSDPYNDVRYYSTLKILFPDKKTFPPIDSFLQTVAEVLTAVPQDSQNGPPAPATVPASAPPPASMAAIPPPPPPTDAPPPTIAIGQTEDQVTAAFGQPQREAKLGVKQIFYYKDMKVTFTNGKVSNVE
jgi:hypothetical protein